MSDSKSVMETNNLPESTSVQADASQISTGSH